MAVGAVVPVAVAAAVMQDNDRRLRPEVVKSVEELLREVRVRRAAPTVQEDEQRPPTSSPDRDDEHLVQIAVGEPARKREALEVCAASRPVAAPEIANGDEAEAK
jgi:hypothetical protein